MPTVSVVIPTHNQATYLGQAIESVQRQTFPDWELWVVDDGSTDQTKDLVAGYLTDVRVHYRVQPHQERAIARNQGITQSSGRYLAFLDADDVWFPQKLEQQVAALRRREDAGLCYTFTRRISGSGEVLNEAWPPGGYEGRILPQLIRRNCIITSTVMVTRRCLNQVGLFDETLPTWGCEDWDLWMRIAKSYDVVCLREPLILYRRHASVTAPEQVVRSGVAVLEKRFAEPRFQSECGLSRDRALATFYLESAGVTEGVSRRTRSAWWLCGMSMHPSSGLRASTWRILASVAVPSWALRRWQRQASSARAPGV